MSYPVYKSPPVHCTIVKVAKGGGGIFQDTMVFVLNGSYVYITSQGTKGLAPFLALHAACCFVVCVIIHGLDDYFWPCFSHHFLFLLFCADR